MTAPDDALADDAARRRPAAPPLRIIAALRDLVRAPGAPSIVIALAIAAAAAPLVLYTIGAERRTAAAPDAHVAMRLYTTWCVAAIALGALTARAAAALVASAMVARLDRATAGAARLGAGEAAARALAHGLPALSTALLATAVAGLGLVAIVVGAIPLACAAFVAAPAAAAEQLAPAAAIRRSAALTRGARGRLAAWIVGGLVVQAAPLVVARLTLLRGAKPPVAPILRMQQAHAIALVTVVIVGALVQVVVYRRLRDAADAR